MYALHINHEVIGQHSPQSEKETMNTQAIINSHKRVLSITTVILAAIMSGSAMAAPGDCKLNPSETTCSFKDPFVEGCDDSFICAFAADPGKVAVAVRYSPRCQSAWAVANNEGNFNRVRATIVSNDGFGSARDGSPSSVSEMLYLGNPYRAVQGIGRLLEEFVRGGVTGTRVIGIAQTPFVKCR